MKPVGKKETLLQFLERGVAMLHLDARRPGVAVPAQHADDPHLRINLSYRYGIPDLVIDDRRVQATLSFGGRPFQCQLPWSAVFGITSQHSGDGQVWPEDLPTEVVSAIADEEKPGGAAKAAPKAKRPSRPALVAVEGAPVESAAPADERPVARVETPASPPAAAPAAGPDAGDGKSDPPTSDAPRRGHLRLIR